MLDIPDKKPYQGVAAYAFWKDLGSREYTVNKINVTSLKQKHEKHSLL